MCASTRQCLLWLGPAALPRGADIIHPLLQREPGKADGGGEHAASLLLLSQQTRVCQTAVEGQSQHHHQ